MYDTYHRRGLMIIAVPCNQFGAQEPGTAEEVKEWAKENYQVDFPIIEKLEVVGEGAHPIYKNLKLQLPESEIKWNFAKYLIRADGKALKFYEPGVDPEELIPDFESMLEDADSVPQ